MGATRATHTLERAVSLLNRARVDEALDLLRAADEELRQEHNLLLALARETVYDAASALNVDGEFYSPECIACQLEVALELIFIAEQMVHNTEFNALMKLAHKMLEEQKGG